MARPGVIFFDVNETLLDLTPLKESVGETLGGRPELAPLWFTTLLQYSLVSTVAGRYNNFDEIGAACLRMIAKSLGLELGGDAAERCLAPMRCLPPHPDVVPALERLRDAGFRLATLTNSGMVQERSFSGNTRDLSADPDRSRVGAGLRESLVAALGASVRREPGVPQKFQPAACGSPVSNSAGLLPTRVGSSLRRYRRLFRKN